MSDYNRTTRECPVSQLHPEIFRTLTNYFQEQKLGELETETVACCETISRKKHANGLVSRLNSAEDSIIHTGILLTSQWLIWVRNGDKSGTVLSAAHLNHISVNIYSSIFEKDTGLEITGQIEGSKGTIRGHIGMGPEAATQKFCDEVIQAITRLNPPKQRGWPKWLGG